MFSPEPIFLFLDQIDSGLSLPVNTIDADRLGKTQLASSFYVVRAVSIHEVRGQ